MPTDPILVTNQSGQPAKKANPMTAGEMLNLWLVMAANLMVLIFTVSNPAVEDSLLPVAIFAFGFGIALVVHARHRSKKHKLTISGARGLFSAAMWAIFSAGVVLIGSDYANGDKVAWVAFVSYLIAFIVCEFITGLTLSKEFWESAGDGAEDGIDGAFDD